MEAGEETEKVTDQGSEKRIGWNKAPLAGGTAGGYQAGRSPGWDSMEKKKDRFCGAFVPAGIILAVHLQGNASSAAGKKNKPTGAGRIHCRLRLERTGNLVTYCTDILLFRADVTSFP